ncbi:transposase [Microtetraspora fusca]|uniref:Transposase n=1 Tax=Microtetraspora fusca TaxID=1997 RepID=A0ABW6VAP7_MICFU
MSERKPYPSDLSDERWALIEPVITAWKAAHPSVSGHQGGYHMREIVNAILFQSRTGCQWAFLPHDLPPRSAVYYYFAKWRDEDNPPRSRQLRWGCAVPARWWQRPAGSRWRASSPPR